MPTNNVLTAAQVRAAIKHAEEEVSRMAPFSSMADRQFAFARALLAAHPGQTEPQCNCDMRTKVLGDGCAVCQPEPRDAIARSKRILALVDEYHENPTRDTRTALRVALMNEFHQEPKTTVRIERLRKALFESRDAMRVMSNWVKKSDPAGHSWAVRMVDRANAALNGEPEPSAEVTGWSEPCDGCATPRACQYDGCRKEPSAEVTADDLSALLPGTYYMDPPDGGDVSLLEQLRRMAEDSARYRWLRKQYWHESSLFVVAGGKCRIQLGTDCPADERLDAAIDAALAQRHGEGL